MLTLPPNLELLGTSPGRLQIEATGSHTAVKLTEESYHKLAAAYALAAPEAPPRRLYLILEEVSGTQAGAVLRVYVSPPPEASAAPQRPLLVGSAGLYGLRRASVTQAQGGPGLGLSFTFDITQAVGRLLAEGWLEHDRIRVSVVPDRPKAGNYEVAVKLISIFMQQA